MSKKIIIATALFFSLFAIPSLTQAFSQKTSYLKEEVTKEKTHSEIPAIKIAFLGDQGYSDKAENVLQMIKRHNVDAISLGGDFGYDDDPSQYPNWDESPQKWFDIHQDIIYTSTPGGAVLDTPILGVIGNHDELQWEDFVDDNGVTRTGYKNYLIKFYNDYMTYQAANPQAPRLECNFKNNDINEIAKNTTCTIGNINIVYSIIGEQDPWSSSSNAQFLPYIEQSLQAGTTPWNICTWHRNNNLLQVGDKTGDRVGYEAYNLCRKYGAIVASHHEHSYSRTHTIATYSAGIADLSNAIVPTAESLASNGQVIRLVDHNTLGTNFTFVSGLGGKSIRGEKAAEFNSNRWLTSYPWWASYSVRQDGARTNFFHVDTQYTSYATLNAAQSSLPNKKMLDSATPPSSGRTVKDGALICTFNYDNDPRKALCEFINVEIINGSPEETVVDRFTIISDVDQNLDQTERTTDLSVIGEEFFSPYLYGGETLTMNFELYNTSNVRIDDATATFNIQGQNAINTLEYKTNQMSEYAPLKNNSLTLENMGLSASSVYQINLRFTVNTKLTQKQTPLIIDLAVEPSVLDTDMSNNSKIQNFILLAR